MSSCNNNFKVGDRVKVVKEVGSSWVNPAMTMCIGQTYFIDKIDNHFQTFILLKIYKEYKYGEMAVGTLGWWFVPEALEKADSQLLFSFMKE